MKVTRQGVRDLDALGPQRSRNAAPRDCIEAGEQHRWRPTGQTRVDDGGGFDCHGNRYPAEVCDEYACPCGVTEWRTR